MVASAVGARSTGRLWAVVVLVGVPIGRDVLVYVFSAFPRIEVHVDQSLSRLLLQVAPTAIVLTVDAVLPPTCHPSGHPLPRAVEGGPAKSSISCTPDLSLGVLAGSVRSEIPHAMRG